MLGTPLGRPAYVSQFAHEKMEKQQSYLDQIEKLQDPQCAWLLLSLSASLRANYLIRMLPPSQSQEYAEEHDRAMWQSFCNILGATAHRHDKLANDIATMPARLGGLGLRSAARSAGGAFWASWAGVLPVVQEKLPTVAAAMVAQLDAGQPVGSLAEAEAVRTRAQDAGTSMPSWRELAQGAQPSQPHQDEQETGFDRGWQCHISSFIEQHHFEHVVWPGCDQSRSALLLSQCGGASNTWLRAIPSERAFQLSPLRFQVAMRRRLRWPLPLSGGQCCKGCRKTLDVFGDRAAACSISGRLKLRSGPIEKVWARILREAKARVRENVMLRDTAVPNIDPSDGRRIEVVASGLPVAHGVPVAVDATMVSPLHADGSAWEQAAWRPGHSFKRAYKDKCKTYPELCSSSTLQLRVAAVETGGRLCKEAIELIETAAHARASSDPQPLRRQTARSWRARWLAMLGIACQDALAATLVSDGASLLDAAVGVAPEPVDIWLDGA